MVLRGGDDALNKNLLFLIGICSAFSLKWHPRTETPNCRFQKTEHILAKYVYKHNKVSSDKLNITFSDSETGISKPCESVLSSSPHTKLIVLDVRGLLDVLLQPFEIFVQVKSELIKLVSSKTVLSRQLEERFPSVAGLPPQFLQDTVFPPRLLLDLIVEVEPPVQVHRLICKSRNNNLHQNVL